MEGFCLVRPTHSFEVVSKTHTGLDVVLIALRRTSRSPSSALLPFLGEGSPTKIDYWKKVATLILTSLLVDLDMEAMIRCAGTDSFSLRDPIRWRCPHPRALNWLWGRVAGKRKRSYQPKPLGLAGDFN